MSAAGFRTVIPHSQLEQLRDARGILRSEAEAILEVVDRLGETFCAACELLRGCAGSVIVTGMGKAGLVGRKIAATLSSTGTRARFLHPADAVHGDLGFVQTGDVALALSNSGETGEVCELVPLLRRLGVTVVAMTGREESTLGRGSDLVIALGELKEAGPHGLAPTTSTTVMMAVGDALALVVSRMKGFTPQDFATYHPGGNLGARLRRVRETMRRGTELRIASQSQTVRSVFVDSGNTGRRTGAVMLVDDAGRLSGLFTDSDLARLLAARQDGQLDRPIAEVMTKQPLTVSADLLMHDVIGLLSQRKFSELPVVDEENRPIGMVDITDVVGIESNDNSV
jgi:arabinose-5-phosphate isomerase